MVTRRTPTLTRRAVGAMVVASLAVLTLQVVGATAASASGYDVSWPNCGRALPIDGDVAIVGVNGGRPYTPNPCLAEQFRWASAAPRQPAFYINTSNPGTASAAVDWYAQRTPNANCSRADEPACAYNFGFNGAAWAFSRAQAVTGAASRLTWWLDVETDNSWSDDVGLNAADILGTVAYLRSQNVPVGIYSTRYQWGRIAGGLRLPDVPSWVAGAPNRAGAPAFCSADRSFTGGPVVLVQWVEGDIDHDHLCQPLPVAGPAAQPPANFLEQLLLDLLRGLGVHTG